MRSTRRVLSSVFRVVIACCGLLLPIVAGAQATNANTITVPTLDGAGLASLAGVLTMTGAWVLARRRSKKR
ncbi:MAG: hypothetical protein ACHQQS_06670 [Thermoanaerobaculales bacterium]